MNSAAILVGMRSAVSHAGPEKFGTRWKASLPGLPAQIANSSLRDLFRCCLAGALAIGLFAGCSKPKEPEHEKADAAKEEPARVQHTATGEIVLTLKAETQQRLGLQVAALNASELAPEAVGYGRVLDPAPLAALVAELAPAQVAAVASRQEFARVQVLHEQNNASTRALQTAEASAKRDDLLVESARARLALGWGRGLGQRDDLIAFVKALVAGEAALVRVDLPAGESLKEKPLGARLFPLGDEAVAVSAEFFDQATSVDPQAQGQGFLFLIHGQPAGFLPGAAVTGRLRLPGAAAKGVLVPRAALVRHEGRAWVYVQSAETTFTRRALGMKQPTEAGWFVAGAWSEKDRVVVVGAQTLLSEELSGAALTGGVRD